MSNASSEIELRGALGWMVREPGRGVRTIMDMVAMTRYDCMLGSSASQRQGVAQAIHHATHRSAFGRLLVRQPLMRNVLADLQLEVEGSLAIALRMARALDHPQDVHERLLLRIGLPVGKYWICKRSPLHAYEGMECLGGNGVIEDFIVARLYRDAPINAIWEGSGNVQAPDVLRAVRRPRQCSAAVRHAVRIRPHPADDRQPAAARQLHNHADAQRPGVRPALFVSAGEYSDFKELNRPRATPFPSQFDAIAYDGSPDFNYRSFRSTNVLRWEFKPGSAMYVVWQQGREDLSGVGRFRSRQDVGGLFGIPANNVFLVKFSYWLNL